VNAPTLRPLGIGEILDVGIKIYWRNAWTLFRIVVFVVLPAQILVGIIQVSALPDDVNTNFNYSFSPGIETTRTDISGSEATTFAVGFAVALIVNALAGKLAQAACFRAVADAYLGEQIGWRSSLRYALRRFPAVIVLSLLSTIFIGLGTIACLIPGIYLWGAFFVAIPVLLVEGARPMRALGRSRELVSGRWWGTIGVAIIGYLLVSIVGGVLTGLIVGVALSPDQNTVAGFTINTIATTLSSMITTPAVAAFATVLYIDLRVRKEGFDLLLLAQRLGVEPRDLGSAPAAAAYLPPSGPVAGEEPPPFWPPPPGWKPSGVAPAPPPPTPAVESPAGEPPSDEPPFWPPPPGWKPGGE
jgi:hypothetical protein